MKTRAEYDAALLVVREVLSAWDPYRLMANGAPTDEFDDEAARVLAKIDGVHSPYDATEVLSAVFGAAFGAAGFDHNKCAGAGEALFAKLVEARFVVA